MRTSVYFSCLALAFLCGCVGSPADYANVEGSEKLGAGDLAGAETQFLEARRLDASNPFALVNLGVVRERQGRMDQGEQFYLEAKKLCGDIVVTTLDQPTVEVPLCRLVDRNLAAVENRRAYADYLAGNFNGSALHSRKALEYVSDSPFALLNLAAVNAAKGNRDTAHGLYLLAVESGATTAVGSSNLPGFVDRTVKDIALASIGKLPPSKAEKHSEFAAELGSYDSAAAADRDWKMISGAVDLESPVHSVKAVAVDGVPNYRLLAGTFATREGAAAYCRRKKPLLVSCAPVLIEDITSSGEIVAQPKAETNSAFAVHLGSYETNAAADRGLQFISTAVNLDTTATSIKEVVVDGRKYYRLLAGTFQTLDDASAYCRRMKTRLMYCAPVIAD